MKHPLYVLLSQALAGYKQGIEIDDPKYTEIYRAELVRLVGLLPHSWSIDCVVFLNFKMSTPERLVFDVNYHHMNNGEGYDYWTKHKIIVTPSLRHQVALHITGVDENGIKDHLHLIFREALIRHV